MLSTYVNTLRRHGLALDELREPWMGDGWLERLPGAARPGAAGRPLQPRLNSEASMCTRAVSVSGRGDLRARCSACSR